MTNESKHTHTPGKWKVEFMQVYHPEIHEEVHVWSDHVLPDLGRPIICNMLYKADMKANAALIAAAPEMLEALKTAKEHLDQYRRYSEEMRKIGRGLMISSEFSEDYADRIISSALAKAEVSK